MYVRELDQFSSAVVSADRETQSDGFWILMISLTGVAPALVASVALHRLLASRRAMALGLIATATCGWIADSELGLSVLVATAAMLSIYLTCGFLVAHVSTFPATMSLGAGQN